jgi:hypothetical protein
MEQTEFKQTKIKQKQHIRFLVGTVLLLFGPTLTTQSQITLGLDGPSASGSLLQLKEKPNVTTGDHNAYKGLALPRVKLSEKDELYPMFLTDPDQPYNGSTNQGTVEYTSNKAALKAEHTGLIVYNLVEDVDKDLCLGLNQWDGAKWVCFESQMGNAVFSEVSCDKIYINGGYTQGDPATAENYITMELNVTKIGAFHITVTTNPDNGYVFHSSGVALGLGQMTINIPCQGTPTTVRTDNLLFEGVTLAAGCQPSITVLSTAAVYSLNCASIVVHGNYLKGTPLTADDKIDMKVTVATGGSYHIIAPLTNGIRFSGGGSLIPGTQTITLSGSGTPTVNADFAISIEANTSQGNATCSATIPITLPAMTYAIIGTDNNTPHIYSWAAVARNNAITNEKNFGPNGTVKIASKFTAPLWSTNSAADVATLLAGSSKPDIVLFNAYDISSTSSLNAAAAALITYIKAGGCVIYGSSDGHADQVNAVLNGVFGAGNATAQSGGSDDDVYPIANLPNNPVINGPFGNLANQHWGEDNASSGSIIVQQLPPNSIQVCTARSASKTNQNPAYSIVWYNDLYNFFYFGDSTGANTDYGSDTSAWPSYYPNSKPGSKVYGPGGSANRTVVNAALELNAVAWGLRKAAVSGINPH